MIPVIPDNDVERIEALAIARMVYNGHSLISPSGASTWMGCVASVIGIHDHRAVAPDNEASIEGTCAHFLLELCLIFRISPLYIQHIGNPEGVVPPDNYVDDVAQWHDRILSTEANTDDVVLYGIECRDWAMNITFPPDMRMEVAKTYDLIMAYVADGWTMIPEMKVKLKPFFGHNQCDGTSDVILYKGDEMIVVDLKYGVRIEVSPVENKQMRVYSGGAISHVYNAFGIVINKLTLVISQSRINDGVWKTWETSYSELYEWLMNVCKPASLRSLYAIGHPEEVTADWYTPSESACKWCHQKVNCPSRRKYAEESTINAFAIAKTAPVIEGSLIPLPFNGKTISDADLGKVLDYMPFIQAWFKDAEKEGLARVRKGCDIGGRKMVLGRNRKSWTNDETTMVKMFMEMGAAPDEVVNIKLKSPAQIRDSAITSEVKTKLLECVVEKRGGDILALGTDTREKVTMFSKSQSAFKEFKDEE